MNTPASAAAKFAAMSDETFFSTDVVIWEGEGEAFKAEKSKRENAKEQERQRTERERTERLRQRKDAVQYSEQLATEICEGSVPASC